MANHLAANDTGYGRHVCMSYRAVSPVRGLAVRVLVRGNLSPIRETYRSAALEPTVQYGTVQYGTVQYGTSAWGSMVNPCSRHV